MKSSPRATGPSHTPARFILRMFGSMLVLNLIVLAIVAYSLTQSRARHSEHAATASKNIAALLAHEISSTIDKIDLVLQSVSDEVTRIEATPNGDKRSLDDFMTRQSRRLPELHGLRTTDPQGNVNHGYGMVKGVRANLSNREYYTQLAQDPHAGLVISKPLVSRVSGEWEIVLARRMERPDGSFDGVVYATIALQHFVDRFSTLDLGKRGVVSLRDGNLALITRHPLMKSVGEDVGHSVVSPQLRGHLTSGQPSGTYVAVAGFDQVMRTSSFHRVSTYPLFLVVGLATEDYLTDWYREVRTAIVLCSAFLCATLLVAGLSFRSWRRRESHMDALGMQERKFRTLLESSPDALVITDEHEMISIVNRQAARLFDHDASALIGRPLTVLLPRWRPGLRPAHAMDGGDAAAEVTKDRDVWAIKRDGHEFPVALSLSPIDTEQGNMVAVAIRDMTALRASEAQIAFLAHHDALTGLPNRLVVQSRFEQAAAQADRAGCKVALLFLDLDNFKTINDSLGHATGDAMLKAVAQRLRDCTRETDTVSRQGGDEFLVVFSQLPGAEAATAMVEKLLERFQPPCVAEGHEIATSFSLGISIYPDDGRDFGTLQKNADIAMYQAKAAGRNTYRFFNEHMNAEAEEQLHLRNDLRQAIERQEFVLHYQPQVDLESGQVTGLEALIRWNHPRLGLVPPGRFIPVAEESGLIVPMGEWVLHEACRQAAAWQRAGLPALSMAVNLSAVQFVRGNAEQVVRDALDVSGLDPACLELEVTESVLIGNIDSALATVRGLKQLGVKLSIDDFGTGYSSLSYLKRFAFDKLKIDQSFIRDLSNGPENAAIVRAIVQMAQGLGLRTIAEGVETEPMLHHLRSIHCDAAQGYFFARPLPAEPCEAFLRAALRGEVPALAVLNPTGQGPQATASVHLLRAR